MTRCHAVRTMTYVPASFRAVWSSGGVELIHRMYLVFPRNGTRFGSSVQVPISGYLAPITGEHSYGEKRSLDNSCRETALFKRKVRSIYLFNLRSVVPCMIF